MGAFGLGRPAGLVEDFAMPGDAEIQIRVRNAMVLSSGVGERGSKVRAWHFA